MLNVIIGRFQTTPLCKRIARDVSIAVIEDLVENDFLTSGGNYEPVVSKLMSCMDPDMIDDISNLVGSEFLEKKYMQMIRSIRKGVIVPLDVFNQFLLKTALESIACHKKFSDPLLKKEIDEALEEYASRYGKEGQYGYYFQKLNALYQFTCMPWLSFSDKESSNCGILFDDQSFKVFEDNDFKTAIWLMASSEQQAGVYYYGEDYVAKMLQDGGVKPEFIANLFGESPFERSEPVDKELLDMLFDEVMGDIMDEAERNGWNDNKIMSEIDKRFGGFIGRPAADIPNTAATKTSTVATVEQDTGIVSELVYFWVLPYKGNEQLLKTMPSRCYMDLIVTYHQQMPGRPDRHIEITNNCLQRNNKIHPDATLSEEDLYQLAMKNTKKLFPCNLVELQDVYANSPNRDELTKRNLPLCTLYNAYRGRDYVFINTSYTLLCPDFLAELRKKIGTDFYIMTFTKQQCVICPSYIPLDYVRAMHEANLELLEPQNRMTPSIYFYSKENRALCFMLDFSLYQ